MVVAITGEQTGLDVGKTYAQVVKSSMKQKYDLQGHKAIESIVSLTVIVSEAKTKKN